MKSVNDGHAEFGTFNRPDGDDRFLLWPEVRYQTGVSRTTAWRMERAGGFPARVQLSPGRVGWRESEVAAWKMSRRLSRLVATVRSRGRAAKAADANGANSTPQALPKAPEKKVEVEPASMRLDGPRAEPAPSIPVQKRSRSHPPVSPGQLGFDF